MLSKHLFLTLFVILLAGAGTAVGQTSEEHDVVTLTAEELGPFRPEQRPTLDRVEQLIVQKTNAFRSDHDLPKVSKDGILQQTARDFADYMARTDRYGHQADDRTPSERARAHEYPMCQIAENIAYFFATEGFATQELAEKAVQGWIDSPPHRKNMLLEHVTEIGVGVAQSEQTGVFYAVQLFGRPKSEAIRFRLKNTTEQELKYQLGERSYTLAPRYIRTHQMCVPGKLSLKTESGKTISHLPDDGDRFVAAVEDGTLVLQKQKME
ncbi:Cysteine-rich secretory protein family protein [Maioricimonas rarisocia]|uniref:Cysteine-rich secretory protein family protein n=1 Tax=Maioricimonas rarisocia TaxID=2528026 RepID=A0A517ZE99_9PLAN|nr:CAP domain-containing protein [Maioricimonas rarisocia]QDU40807.1 Cysteine-rich secretory protein family protein [Maioricimonas rarisocia]